VKSLSCSWDGLCNPGFPFLPTVPCSTAPLIGITGQFADKPTRGQSSRVWINSRTAIFFKLRKHCNKIIIYLCTKQKPNTTLTISTTVSVQWCNLPQITFTAIVYAANFKSNVSASWLVRELTSPWLDRPRVVGRLTTWAQNYGLPSFYLILVKLALLQRFPVITYLFPFSPNSTWLVTFRHDTTLSMCRACRDEGVEPCCWTSSTQPKCMGSTSRTCRVVSRRDVTSQVEFGLFQSMKPFELL